MPAVDDYGSFVGDLSAPAIDGFDITPSDTGELARVTRAIMVTAAGEVAVVFKGGTELSLPMHPGILYPVRACAVKATGTTATGIKGLV